MRTVADVPADGRPVVVHVQVRRIRCAVLDCPVQTFREQVPDVLDRYRRRTTRLAGQAGGVARRLAGRAGAGLLAALGVPLSRHTALRVSLPEVSVPRVLGVDDFALRRGHVNATVPTGAETGERVDVLAGRTAEVVEAWLRDHQAPGTGPGTGPAPTPRRSGGRWPARPRPVTAGTYGMAWPGSS